MVKKNKKIIYNIFKSNGFSALIGVLVGSLITGVISLKTQDKLIENQNNEFKNHYLIKKNDDLKELLDEYLENLFLLTSSEAEENEKRKILINRMSVISTKISLLNNPQIGLKCSNLTNELETYINTKISAEKAEIAKSELLKDIFNELERLEFEIKGVYSK